MTLPPPVRSVSRRAWRHGTWSAGERSVPEETAIAFTYDRTTHAVMMASPSDLEDFAVGFSLTEGIVAAPGQIEALEIVAVDAGIELRMAIARPQGDAFLRRRRHLAGPTGCGLCGLESLGEAVRRPPRVPAGRKLAAVVIGAALAELAGAQPLNRQAKALHAAGFWHPDAGLVAVREDVGRHNALDKLAGALARSGAPAPEGILLLTSRVSVEMVQKAAMLGVPVLAAISAPTALAIRMAEEAGITLIAVARADGFELFTHASRLQGAPVGQGDPRGC
jgi:FdhD protein